MTTYKYQIEDIVMVSYPNSVWLWMILVFNKVGGYIIGSRIWETNKIATILF